MRSVHHALLTLTAAATLSLATVACDDTARGAAKDAREAAADAQAATAGARERAGDAASSGASAVGAAAETVDVKTALMADSTVDATDINVDTVKETKTVVLKGSVPTEAQRTQAGLIAQREAVGYRIDNQLVVKSRM